jgi:hypothetical protein
MQNSIDNELFRSLKFSTQQLAKSIAECLEKISTMEPDVADQKIRNLQIILTHFSASLTATNYTTSESVSSACYLYNSYIENL